MLAASLLPVFLLAAAGALLVRLPWLRPGWHASVTELAARFLVPVLLLGSTYRTGIPAAMSWQVLLAFYLPLGLLYLAAWRLARQHGAAGALAATYSNTVFVGVPVLIQTLGPASLQFAYPVIAFHSLFCFSLFHLTERGDGGWARGLMNTLTNPLVAALLLGLALNLGGLRLPSTLTRALDLLAGAALPCALLSLGGSVALLRPGRWAPTLGIVLAKLVALPLAVFCLSFYVFHLPATATAVLVVLASCPVGLNASFVVQAASDGARLVNSAILLSSLACAATIPAWLWVLRLAMPLAH